METWIEWGRGPIFRFAFAFMVLGLLRHAGIACFEIGRALWRAGDKSVPVLAIGKTTLSWLFPVNKIGTRPLFSVTTIMFHLAILITPVFLAGHIALWKRGTGQSWPSIPNSMADFLTILALASIVAVVIQRMLGRDTRVISRFQDYAIPLLIAVPFSSGHLLMHPASNPFSFDATMLVHVMSANLVFVLIPITKLSHCILLPTTQLVSEVGWHFPPKSGSEVGLLLGKENEQI
ncbi:hypothetical protein ACFL1X_14440 [Candidatus Hydrogenedentota bacterium]